MRYRTIPLRTAVAVGVILLPFAVGCSGSSGTASPKSLTVTTPGGSVGDAFQANVIEPFEEKYDVTIRKQPSQTYDTLAKLRAQKGNPQIDVWSMDQPAASVALSSGLVEPLDEKAVPNLKYIRERYPDDPYVNDYVGTIALVYNTEKVDDPPKEWSDLADERFAGHVALPNNISSAGYSFLLAESYAHGGNTKNVDPGFKAIGKIKPNVLTFWNSQDQMAKLISSGNAWAGVWTYSRTRGAIKDGAPVKAVCPSTGIILTPNVIGISKGTEKKKLAEQFINFAIGKKQQEGYHNASGLIPTNKNAKLKPSIAKYNPSEACMDRSIYPDFGVMAKQISKWEKEWGKRVTS